MLAIAVRTQPVLHGGTQTTVTRYDPTAGTLSMLHLFESNSDHQPVGLTAAANGKLNGMNNNGGDYGSGFTFSFDPLTNTCTRLNEFTDSTNGYAPYGSLIQAADNKRSGMTIGKDRCGRCR